VPPACAGVIYPLLIVLIRRLLLRILRSGNKTESIDFAGIVVLLIEMIVSMPQFCALASIDDTVQFITSVIVCSFTETVGAVWTARTAHLDLLGLVHRKAKVQPSHEQDGRHPQKQADHLDGKGGGRHQVEELDKGLELERHKEQHVGDPQEQRQLQRQEQLTGASDLRREDLDKGLEPERYEEQHEEQHVHVGGPQEQRQLQRQEQRTGASEDFLCDWDARRLLLATKVAHEELGEKLALVVGCAIAITVRARTLRCAANTLVLVLSEMVTDEMKELVYESSGIPTGSISFGYHGPTLLAIVFVGSACCTVVLAGIRVNCLFIDGFSENFTNSTPPTQHH
jgi:hypothetical protein